MILIIIIFLYFKRITHTNDDFPSSMGTRLVLVSPENMIRSV